MKTKKATTLNGRRILVAVSGSIAAVKTPLLVSSLIKAGAKVRCLVTPSAAQLVSPISLASISRNRCYQDEDQWSAVEPRPLHIALAEWAELIVIAPLSATSLGRWTNGIAEGLLSSVLLASEQPVIAAAAMNTGMWLNPSVQNNWLQIKKSPRVLPLAPEEGLLACDRIGEGKMVDPQLIELAANSVLLQVDQFGSPKKDWEGQKLLITAGPTVESLDLVRFVSNKSSGRMGVLLAQAAKHRGACVELIHGPLNVPNSWLEGLITYPIKTANELREVIAKLQPTANAIAMTAAVADVRRKHSLKSKKIEKQFLLNSLEDGWETVPDLLAEVASRKLKRQLLLGFTALSGDSTHIKAIGEVKRIKKGCDLMMANPIDIPGQGFESNENGGWLLGPEGVARKIPVATKLAIAHQLLDSLTELKRPSQEKMNQNFLPNGKKVVKKNN